MSCSRTQCSDVGEARTRGPILVRLRADMRARERAVTDLASWAVSARVPKHCITFFSIKHVIY